MDNQNLNDLTSLPSETNIPYDLNTMTVDDIPTMDETGPEQIPYLESQLYENYKQSFELDPNKIAKIDKYSKQFDFNPKIIEKNLDGIEKVINSPDSSYWREYEQRYPESAKFLKDQKNMAMAHDDHENIANIERTANKMGMIGTFYSDLINVGLSSSYSNLLRGADFLNQTALNLQNAAVESVGLDNLKVNPEDSLLSKGIDKVAGYYEQQSKVASELNPYEQDIVKLASDGKYGEASISLVRSLLQNAPQQITNIMLASSGAGIVASMGVTGLSQAGSAFNESKNSGASITARTIDALSQGAYESLLENLGTMSVVKRMETALEKSVGRESAKEILKQTAQKLGAAFFQEGSEEFVTTIAQESSKALTGVDSNAMDGIGNKAFNSFLIGGFSGATMTAPITTTMALGKMANEKRAKVLSNTYSQFIDNINNSKLKERSPEAHANLVEEMVKASAIENAHIKADVLSEFFQSRNIDANKMYDELGVADQINEALDTGGEVTIPLAKIATKLDSETAKALKNDLKFSENSLSINEAKEFDKGIQEQLKKIDEQATSLKNEKSGFKEAYNTIYNESLDQIIKTGQDRKLAENNAKVFTNMMLVSAADKGIDPVVHFRNESLKITTNPSSVPVNYQRNAIPEFNKDTVLGSDQVSKAIDELGLGESYKNPEAISAIRRQVENLISEISQAKAGERQYFNDGKSSDMQVVGVASTFPEWFKKSGFKDKATFLKVASKGNSSLVKNLIEVAVNGLENGHGDSSQFALAPNLDFVSLVNPSKINDSFARYDEFQKYFGDGVVAAQNTGNEFFQTEKDIRRYIELSAKGKPILFTQDQTAPVAEFDKLTGQLTINTSQVKNSLEADQILNQFAQAKRSEVKNKIDVNINGETIEIDANKAVNAIARKLYNLQRLAECSRG